MPKKIFSNKYVAEVIAKFLTYNQISNGTEIYFNDLGITKKTESCNTNDCEKLNNPISYYFKVGNDDTILVAFYDSNRFENLYYSKNSVFKEIQENLIYFGFRAVFTTEPVDEDESCGSINVLVLYKIEN